MAMQNIEKSGFHKGEHVGYAVGTVWRIVKGGEGYRATAREHYPDSTYPKILTARTLGDMSVKLDGLYKERKSNPIDAARLKYEAALKASTRTHAPRGKKRVVAKKTVKHVVRRANPVVKKKYFVMGRDGQLEITTPTYIVSLPIALDYPIVARELLIVHKSVDTKGWTVTHAATGYAFSRGETRAKAILKAQSAIIKYGEEKIMNSIHRVGG